MLLEHELTRVLDEAKSEEEVHRFLAENPDILITWACGGGEKTKFHSKVNLHSSIPDFAIGNFRMTTNRWEWTLIEIERPDHRLFTKAGNPTSELTHALRQITDWRAWLQNNLSYGRTILPDVIPLCDAAVIIGRRNCVSESHRDRLEMLQIQSPGVRICTFDSLVDTCRLLGS